MRQNIKLPGMRERWRHVRRLDFLPIASHILRGQAANADGSGTIRDFEEQFAHFSGTKFALAMNSGTAALHSALFAVGVKPGDEVILPSYTWHATASAILCCGAIPVFCDINPKTLTADPADIEARITGKTKAIVPVHVWGNPCEMDRICEIAKKHGLKLIEDCSHAHGASYKGKKVGAWGDAGCFSLQGSKAVTAGEGGVAICSDEKMYDRMLLLGQPVRTASARSEEVRSLQPMNLGPKYRIHLFAALLARESFKRLQELNRLRRKNWEILCGTLSELPAIRAVETLAGGERGGVLEFKLIGQNNRPGFADQLIKSANEANIPLSLDRYGQLHEKAIFQTAGKQAELPRLESLRGRIVTLPAFAKVSPDWVRRCGRLLAEIAGEMHGS